MDQLVKIARSILIGQGNLNGQISLNGSTKQSG